MRPGRIFTSVLAVALVVTTTVAYAAKVVVSTRSMGAGGAIVARCDPDGFDVTYNLGDENVIMSVTVEGIHADCSGGRIRVTLTNGSDVSQGDGFNAPVTSPSTEVSVTGSPHADDVKKSFIVVEGGQP